MHHQMPLLQQGHHRLDRRLTQPPLRPHLLHSALNILQSADFYALKRILKLLGHPQQILQLHIPLEKILRLAFDPALVLGKQARLAAEFQAVEFRLERTPEKILGHLQRHTQCLHHAKRRLHLPFFIFANSRHRDTPRHATLQIPHRQTTALPRLPEPDAEEIFHRRQCWCRHSRQNILLLFFCQPLIPIIPTGCAARCTGTQDFVVPSAQRCQRKIGPVTRHITPTSSIRAVSWRSPSRSPVLTKASHGATKHGEKFSLGTPTSSSASAQQLSAMTLRQLRQTQCVKTRGQFVLLPDSNA